MSPFLAKRVRAGGPKEKNGLPDPRYLDIWTEQVPDNQLEPSNRQNWKQMQYTQHMKDLEAQTGGSFNLGGARAYLGCPVLVVSAAVRLLCQPH